MRSLPEQFAEKPWWFRVWHRLRHRCGSVPWGHWGNAERCRVCGVFKW